MRGFAASYLARQRQFAFWAAFFPIFWILLIALIHFGLSARVIYIVSAAGAVIAPVTPELLRAMLDAEAWLFDKLDDAYQFLKREMTGVREVSRWEQEFDAISNDVELTLQSVGVHDDIVGFLGPALETADYTTVYSKRRTLLAVEQLNRAQHSKLVQLVDRHSELQRKLRRRGRFRRGSKKR